MQIYKTHGVCSSFIEYEVEDGIVKKVNIIGGCRGNSQGVSRLAEGRKVEDVISCLKGIKCRQGTSCPDQLALALEEYVESKHD